MPVWCGLTGSMIGGYSLMGINEKAYQGGRHLRKTQPSGDIQDNVFCRSRDDGRHFQIDQHDVWCATLQHVKRIELYTRRGDLVCG